MLKSKKLTVIKKCTPVITEIDTKGLVHGTKYIKAQCRTVDFLIREWCSLLQVLLPCQSIAELEVITGATMVAIGVICEWVKMIEESKKEDINLRGIERIRKALLQTNSSDSELADTDFLDMQLEVIKNRKWRAERQIELLSITPRAYFQFEVQERFTPSAANYSMSSIELPRKDNDDHWEDGPRVMFNRACEEITSRLNLEQNHKHCYC